MPFGTPNSVRDATGLSGEARAAAEEARVRPKLLKALHAKGLDYGAPIFIRIFKQNQKHELWMLSGYEYKLFKTYSICNFSGKLGPKLTRVLERVSAGCTPSCAGGLPSVLGD